MSQRMSRVRSPAVPVLLTTEEKVAERPEDKPTAPVQHLLNFGPLQTQPRKRAKEGEQLEDELRDVYKPKNIKGVTKAKTYKV